MIRVVLPSVCLDSCPDVKTMRCCHSLPSDIPRESMSGPALLYIRGGGAPFRRVSGVISPRRSPINPPSFATIQLAYCLNPRWNQSSPVHQLVYPFNGRSDSHRKKRTPSSSLFHGITSTSESTAEVTHGRGRLNGLKRGTWNKSPRKQVRPPSPHPIPTHLTPRRRRIPFTRIPPHHLLGPPTSSRN